MSIVNVSLAHVCTKRKQECSQRKCTKFDNVTEKFLITPVIIPSLGCFHKFTLTGIKGTRTYKVLCTMTDA
jgi:hypothetical protein